MLSVYQYTYDGNIPAVPYEIVNTCSENNLLLGSTHEFQPAYIERNPGGVDACNSKVFFIRYPNEEIEINQIFKFSIEIAH